MVSPGRHHGSTESYSEGIWARDVCKAAARIQSCNNRDFIPDIAFFQEQSRELQTSRVMPSVTPIMRVRSLERSVRYGKSRTLTSIPPAGYAKGRLPSNSCHRLRFIAQ